MRRRRFLTALGSTAVLAPVLSSAQQWLPVIAMLAEDPLAKVGAVDAFQGIHRISVPNTDRWAFCTAMCAHHPGPQGVRFDRRGRIAEAFLERQLTQDSGPGDKINPPLPDCAKAETSRSISVASRKLIGITSAPVE
jgi:hypothetical protein